MGADLILGVFTVPHDVTPDFKAGRTYIDKLVKGWGKKGMPKCDSRAANPDDLGELLHSDLKEVEEAYAGRRRDCYELDLFGHSVYLAGGMSWGDSPSDTMDSIHNLDMFDILDRCGFNRGTQLDYAGILSSILENKEALPLLMGKHAQLDGLINKIFRKE